MTPPLPPERDLPPARHRELREALIRTVAGQPVKTSARWLVPVSAAAAVVAVTGTAVAVTSLRGIDPAPRPAATLVTASPDGPAEPAVPGVTPEQAKKIVDGCTANYATQSAAEPLKLYNLVSDDGGTIALLLGETMALTCDIDGPVPYNTSGGHIRARDWLPENAAVDVDGKSAGEHIGKYGETHGSEIAAGRVSRDVARVEATFARGIVEVMPMNGTFLVRKVHPIGWQIPVQTAPVTVRVFDKDGHELPTAGSEACYEAPDGETIAGERSGGAQCRRATPWR